jgi:hypothetical protein
MRIFIDQFISFDMGGGRTKKLRDTHIQIVPSDFLFFIIILEKKKPQVCGGPCVGNDKSP